MPAAEKPFVSLADLLRSDAGRRFLAPAARDVPAAGRASEVAVNECSPPAEPLRDDAIDAEIAAVLAVGSDTVRDSPTGLPEPADEAPVESESGPALRAADGGGSGESALPSLAPATRSETLDAIRDARLFRAALADCFDDRLRRLERELAQKILLRELELAPADVEALAARLIDRYAADSPVRVRVALADAGVVCSLPLVADPDLMAGDAILECRSGSIDARLATRLAVVLGDVS